MRMNLSKDRQGFLEDVDSMTLPQLKDLLDRQEKILAKKKFIASLPDKGKKSQQFAETLRELIAVRGGGSHPSNSSSLLKEKPQRLPDECSKAFIDKGSMTIEALVTRNETDATFSSETDGDMDVNAADNLTQQLKEMTVGNKTSEHSQQPLPSNSYERVIKKVEENPADPKVKFLPNRSKKHEGFTDNTSAKRNQQPTKVHDESAVHPPVYTHESTKLISIGESVELIQDQRNRAEQMAAERAAQRLAEHFTTKMEPYQTASVDMGYRHPKTNNDDDGDDDCDNNDQDSDDVPTDDDNDADEL